MKCVEQEPGVQAPSRPDWAQVPGLGYERGPQARSHTHQVRGLAEATGVGCVVPEATPQSVS